ncbi:uncharacterized protein LOC123510999 [Portunus trituberculatus]|uniref:uncharacterized protein LOC123510999 n=1 Tax=Portunus trituberculatus TaxID=210409 RepID=UPI001E1D1441|nr:uncharacterized protein LOC123510999 [Portunus trituberculatus]
MQDSMGNYLIALPLLFLLCHSILSLGRQDLPGPPQVYPSSAFVVRTPHRLIGVAPFTFSFSGNPSRRCELLRMAFRPMAALKTLPKPKNIKQLLQCSNDKCRALANPFWVTRDSDGKLVCNICEVAVSVAENTEDTSLSHNLLSGTDVHCLVGSGQPRIRPRLVFVLDGALLDVRTCIHRWAAATHGVPDVEVLCHETRTCRLYSDGKIQEEAMEGRGSLGTVVDRAWTAVAARGGRVVFISGQEGRTMKADVLDALVVAASQVTLNVVCVSGQAVGMNPLLQPLVMHHQAQNGGSTRLVERSRDVLKLVQSGIFLFRGVMAHGRVRWTPGVEVVRVEGRGVTSCFHPDTDSFSMACVDPERQLEFRLRVDPDKVFSRHRLSDPEDNNVYFQLQMLYTNPEGNTALCVFNRMFSIDDGQ